MAQFRWPLRDVLTQVENINGAHGTHRVNYVWPGHIGLDASRCMMHDAPHGARLVSKLSFAITVFRW